MIRELFVELGAAAFAEAKALGEAFEAALAEAARQRETPKMSTSARLGLLSLDNLRLLVQLYAQHYRPSWKFSSVTRNVATNVTVVCVKLSCGHRAYYPLDELALFRELPNERAFVEYVFRVLGQEEPEHRCKCGIPQGLGPAGRHQ